MFNISHVTLRPFQASFKAALKFAKVKQPCEMTDTLGYISTRLVANFG